MREEGEEEEESREKLRAGDDVGDGLDVDGVAAEEQTPPAARDPRAEAGCRGLQRRRPRHASGREQAEERGNEVAKRGGRGGEG